VLRDENVVRKLGFFFKVNERLATGVGYGYGILLN
jgi:hypothetical protein